MFVAASFTILPSYKKGNEILSFMTTWMDPEAIMLSEIGPTEKDKYHMISRICGILKQKAETDP